MNQKILNSNWLFKEGTNSTWREAIVPGSVMSDLLRLDLIDDPYYEDNEWKTLEILKKNYEYKTKFEVTKEMLQSDIFRMVFKGLDTICYIYINDRYVMKTQNMHRTYMLDLREYVSFGINDLNIYFKSPANAALEMHEVDPIYTTSDTIDGFTQIRKAHCNYGWDWGPRLPDMGVFRDVIIEWTSRPIIEEVFIKQNHCNDEVRISVDCVVDNEKGKENIVISLFDDNNELVLKKQGDLDETSFDLDIINPKLWWPNGYGIQPLYTIEIELYDKAGLSDKKLKRIGLRTFTIKQEKDCFGESFTYLINDVEIFAMGANYIPEDCIIDRLSYDRTRSLLMQCKKVNFNTIRVWGGGYFPEDSFYDICDELGLVVWQDLMFACGVYKLDESFIDEIVNETKDNLRRIRHHASLGIICANNENEWGFSGWDMGFGNDPYRKADYIKQNEYILPQVVKEVASDVFFWPSSPSSGGAFDNPNDPDRGDVHYWDVWHRLKPFDEYANHYFRFLSEFGFQSFPEIKTIKMFCKEEDFNIFSYTMEQHQKNGVANSRILFYLSDIYKYPYSFEDLIYASQLLQAEAIRFGVTHLRSCKPRCMGTIYWQLNDCYPVASWSSIDYANRWKALHYYAKRFYKDVLLCVMHKDGKLSFSITSERKELIDYHVEISIIDNKGKEHASFNHKGKLEAHIAKPIKTIVTKKYEEQKKYMQFAVFYKLYVNDVCIQNESMLFCRPKYFKFNEPNLKVEVLKEDDKYLLNLSSDNYAKDVAVLSDSFDFVLSDNFIDLRKGEQRTLVVEEIKSDNEITAKRIEDKIYLKSVYDIGRGLK